MRSVAERRALEWLWRCIHAIRFLAYGDLRIPDALLESAFTDGNDLNAIRPCYLHIVALRSFDGT